MGIEQELQTKVLQLQAQVDVLQRLVVELSGSGDNRRTDATIEKAKGQAQIFTMKQHAVLQMLHLGFSNKDIASALGVAESTVKVHVKAIMDKLGVRSRGQVCIATKELMAVDADDYEAFTQLPKDWATAPSVDDAVTRMIKTKTK
jgi:DNA-binding NarL/FixJ family response regulator